MKCSVFCDEVIEFTSEPLFLGTGRNVSRLDLNIEQHIKKSTDKALGLLWFKTDFSYKKDAEDYANFSKDLKILFDKNLKFQTLADSVAARSISEVFLPVTTSPMLEEWWFMHSFFENNIHSGTYAEIIKALPVDAKNVFDDIMVNDHIKNRAKDIVKCFDETVFYNSLMVTGDSRYSEEDHKTSLVKSLYALNILESVFFKSSFVTTFAFGENNYMESSVKAVKKISIDEIMHYQMSIYLLRRLKDLPDWGYIFKNVENEVIGMYKEAYKSDFEWIDYLFNTDGSTPLLGLNNYILKEYVTYNMNNVLRLVDLPSFVNSVKNPCTWVDKYTNLSNVQVAMKETDSANYLLGKVDDDVTMEDFKGFNL